MLSKKWKIVIPCVIVTAAVIIVVMFSMGHLSMSGSTASTNQQSTTATHTPVYLPEPIQANSATQVTFQGQTGDSISFQVVPEQGVLSLRALGDGGTISVKVYFGSQVLYSNTAADIQGTANLPQTGAYTFEITNNNNFEIQMADEVSHLTLNHQ